uniref:Diacylglycerol acyltransferase n=1 Tax=Timema bartmani TaxID=61472 RepID=A0A7R9FD17_9NEOP|nr:unnamed protein product [Timema bartmani]
MLATPLVPVVSFGETDLYDQVSNPEGSWLRWVQDHFRKVFGIAPIIPLGRGFFQYSFGFIPRRCPVFTVVGRPMEVEKIPDPSRQQVDEVHQRFTDHLLAFFEAEKHKYVKESDKTVLEIE